MDVCPDYEDLFKTLNAYKIRYLVVGAHAVIYYSQPRYTKDTDIWIIPDLNDADAICSAVADFGAPMRGLTAKDFSNRRLILQIGVEPVRIDILMNVDGISFARAWRTRKRILYGATPIHILGYEALIRTKRRAGRPQENSGTSYGL